MAIGDDYLTLDDIKRWTNYQGNEKDDIFAYVITAVSRDIEDYCHRQFNDAGVASARVYAPVSRDLCIVDDFWTTDGLVIQTDNDGDGVFETTWTEADYELRPLNGVRNGRPGWPYWQIRARPFTGANIQRFHHSGHGVANVQVTARWGWQVVPASVVQAGRMLCADTFSLKDNRLGIAGADQFGTVVRVRDNLLARARLKEYARSRLMLNG